MSHNSHSLANPTPIGLFGLAMVTFVASSAKLGITDGTSLIIPWAIFLGAAAQLYASIVDAKLNNTFGATAFAGYSFFWFSVAMTWGIQNGMFGAEMQANADVHQIGFAYIGYLIFSIYMTIGALTTNKNLFFIFVLIDFLFIGLSLSTLGIMEHEMHMLAAYSEFAIALLGFYGSASFVLESAYGRVILPVGSAFIKPGAKS